MSGGGPLLVLFAWQSFAMALGLGAPVLWAMLAKGGSYSSRRALVDALAVSALSTMVCLCLPLMIAGMGLAGEIDSGKWGKILLALGTWVTDGNTRNGLALVSAAVWFLVLVCVKPVIEGWLLKDLWHRRREKTRLAHYRAAGLCGVWSGGVAVATWHILWGRHLFPTLL